MGVELIGMPPPSSGGAAVAQIIEFLDGYDLPLASAGTLGAHKRHMDKPVQIPHGEFSGKRWSNAS